MFCVNHKLIKFFAKQKTLSSCCSCESCHPIIRVLFFIVFRVVLGIDNCLLIIVHCFSVCHPVIQLRFHFVLSFDGQVCVLFFWVGLCAFEPLCELFSFFLLFHYFQIYIILRKILFLQQIIKCNSPDNNICNNNFKT